LDSKTVDPELYEIKNMDIYEYAPGKREPKFANADKSCFWELNLLSKHFHPTVAKWAQFIVSGEEFKYKGNPLQDFDISAFLDRIVYKNPKKNPEDKIINKGSIMQSRYIRHVDKAVPVNTPEFLIQNEEDVREEELFFYKYFKYQNQFNKKKKKKEKN